MNETLAIAQRLDVHIERIKQGHPGTFQVLAHSLAQASAALTAAIVREADLQQRLTSAAGTLALFGVNIDAHADVVQISKDTMGKLIATEACKAKMLEALELLQGFDFRLDESPHGVEIRRRAVAAIDAAKS